MDRVNRSEAIYGPHIPIIQGKATIVRLENNKTIPKIPLPTPIANQYHNVEIAMNVSL